MDVDVAVVGGGIAGISVAAELSRVPGLSVALLEQEYQLAYHTSGRSAAAFLESYGSAEIRALTRASRPLLDAVSAGPEAPALLRNRPLLWLAPSDQVDLLVRLLAAEPLLRAVTPDQAYQLCPALRPGWTAAAAVEDGAQDLDVGGLFEHYRRTFVGNAGRILTGFAVRGGQQRETGWLLRTDAEEIRARYVVNAAGAWADDVAVRCGVHPCGLTPLRRTVAIAAAPGVDRRWPLICDIGETFYLRPEGDGLLISPADEIRSEPCDAKPDTADVALALDRVNQATTLNLRHVRAAWAGLRTFARDRNPVVGFDPLAPGFFWLAGQGGYGMQTAPAIAVLAAAVLLGTSLPHPLADERLDPSRLSPARFEPSSRRPDAAQRAPEHGAGGAD